jgi:hypothetical protein
MDIRASIEVQQASEVQEGAKSKCHASSISRLDASFGGDRHFGDGAIDAEK